MNRNHAGHGRFCSRTVARTVSPLSSRSMEEFESELYGQIQATICSHSDIIEAGGKGLVLLYPTGSIEVVILSSEGYAAYAGTTKDCETLSGRKGKIGGIQDGHNIRRGVRRWIGRNDDIIDDEGIRLCVIRDDDDVLRLSAVVMAQ